MKTTSFLTALTALTSLCLFAGIAPPAHAGDPAAAEREAHRMIAEIEHDVLTEQFRHVRMEAFQAQLELRMHSLKVRQLPEPDQAVARRELELQEQRVHLLEEMSNELREQIIRTHVHLADMEAEAEHAEHADHPEYAERAERAEYAERAERAEHREAQALLNGEWIGRDVENNAELRLRVEHGHARLEVPRDGLWVEGDMILEPVDDGLSHVEFRIHESSEPDFRGRAALGLARLTDDRLVLAANEPGNPSRPTRLEQDDSTRLFEFERE